LLFDAELVAKGLLTRTELIDAIVGIQRQPVFSLCHFVGYQINGISGAFISTLAIFLPSFVFVALLNPMVKKNEKLFCHISGCCKCGFHLNNCSYLL
jgi:chromate transporter